MRASSRMAGELSPLTSEQISKFGTIVRALWPDKPALNLAQRIGCTERAAQFYITGDRKPSFRAVRAVLNEIE